MSLRDDKRRWTMREVQASALDLFEANGYDEVSVEAIAAAAGVSAPTVYRHFGSKERIVLWDDYDPDLLASITDHARKLPPLAAIEAGLIAALDRIYTADARRVLRRSRLLLAHPALQAANAPLLAELRRTLAQTLAEAYGTLGDDRARLLAAIVVAALEEGIGRWVEARGKTSLNLHFRQAFTDLRNIVLTDGVLA